jgi:beta-galactosidase
VEALNAAWGTAFWSQQYGAWDEIQPPRKAPTFANPAQQLDWRRFSSDALLACFELEVAILRGLTPAVPVTTNFMLNFKPLDYWAWAAREDLVTLDSYPDPADPEAHVDAAMNYDLARSLRPGEPWLLMEQAPSHVNWRPHNLLKRPGQMRLWSHQAIARGSNGAMFFQWRASRAGAEKFHSGMLPHGGTATRTWREIAALGQELRGLDALLPTRVQADVGVLFDWESWWALELDSKPSRELRLLEQLRRFYAPLYARNITVDFVPPGGELGRYRLLLAPNLYLVRAAEARRLEAYVAAGGTLVMGPFSGIVDEQEQIHLGGYPAPFRKLLGLWIEEFAPYAPGQSNEIVAESGASFVCDLWGDVIELEGAAAIASFSGDFYAGRPAITRNSFGAGAAYYLGTRPEATAMAWLLERACAEAGVGPAAAAPAGVEAIRRRSPAGDELLYLLNHRAEPATVALQGPADELLSGNRLSGELTLEGGGVAILVTAREGS